MGNETSVQLQIHCMQRDIACEFRRADYATIILICTHVYVEFGWRPDRFLSGASWVRFHLSQRTNVVTLPNPNLYFSLSDREVKGS